MEILIKSNGLSSRLIIFLVVFSVLLPIFSSFNSINTKHNIAFTSNTKEELKFSQNSLHSDNLFSLLFEEEQEEEDDEDKLRKLLNIIHFVFQSIQQKESDRPFIGYQSVNISVVKSPFYIRYCALKIPSLITV